MTERKPVISILGVGVFGVTSKNGVPDNGVEVMVDAGVGVSVFTPISVGVNVKVSVGVTGVSVGTSVGTVVGGGKGVEVATGSKNSCSRVREQEESIMAQIRKMLIFFIK